MTAMKRTYIKPEMELMDILETVDLLQNSISGSIDPDEDEEGRFQSKGHDFGYNTWEDWDNSGSTVWDDKASSLWD